MMATPPEKRLLFYSGLSGYHWLVLVVACLGWSFDTMDQWLYVFVKQHALRGLLPIGVPDADVSRYVGLAQTALILGWATGGILFGMIGDMLGRTRTMIITILMYAGFTGLSALSRSWQDFLLLRFLTGLGVGGEFAAGAALVAETLPSHARSAALGIVQACSALGNVVAGMIHMTVYAMAPPETAWRWTLAVGALPILLVVVIFLFIHEPELWRAARETARQRVREGKHSGQGIAALFREREIRRNTLIGLSIAAIGVIGFWGISTWTPELLRGILAKNSPELAKGTVERWVGLAGIAQNLGAFVGALCFAPLAERFGRRGAFAVAFGGCLLVIPITFVFTNSPLTALFFFAAMGFMLLFLLSGCAVYFPELFPTRLRATGAGFCYNAARYLSAPSPALFGELSAMMGLQRAALALSSIFIFGLLLLPWAPETKGKPLPE